MSSDQGAVPKVWYFVPCDRVDRWGDGPFTLTRVRLEVPNPLGHTPPRTYPELQFYLALTDGTGVHILQIHQTCLRDQTRVVRWPSSTIDMGNDLTAIHEKSITLRDLVFWTSGQCEFTLYCGGVQVAEAVIDVR